MQGKTTTKYPCFQKFKNFFNAKIYNKNKTFILI